MQMLPLPSANYSQSRDETPPTTPRPSTILQLHPSTRMDESTTPTRATFARPAEPMPAPPAVTEDVPDPRRRRRAPTRDSVDVDMDASDESGERSDGSVNADESGKKKKSQRFYCTDYPPCTLSFTRSEHLARHIRKHTGERPFQCHCSRRFSRLDNLRQHAQTVHVNEEIPIDSLAATGPARFPRQVRTERARPQGMRSRATTGSQQGPIRGHQRNSLSASSIASVGSFTSAYGPREDARMRPAPLVMAGSRMSGEVLYRPDSPGHYPFRPPSPGGFSTPQSSTFSLDQSSPRWSSSLQSPTSAHTHSRSQSLYSTPRTPGRRLSVPSPSYPYHIRGGSYGPPPITLNSPVMSPTGAMLASPTSSAWSRRDSESYPTDETYKRKTWAHPEPYPGFAPRLQNRTQAHYHSPAVPNRGPPSEQNQMRLPGIESFDSIPRSTTPVNRQGSPMVIDTPTRPPTHGGEPYREETRGSQHWDRPYPDRLDVGRGPPAYDSAGTWASEATVAVHARAEQARAEQARIQAQEQFVGSYPDRTHHQGSHQHQSAPVATPREAKRQAWYQGPISTHPPEPVVDPQLQRTSPEGSSSSENVPDTPSSSMTRDSNPGIVHASGYVETRDNYPGHDPRTGSAPEYPHPHGPDAAYTYAHGQQAPQADPQHQEPKAPDNNMLRLEALVAVATSEENVAATAY